MRSSTRLTSHGTDRRTRAEAGQTRGEVPLLLLALAFLVAYAWLVIDPSLDRDLRGFLEVVSWMVWEHS